MREGWRIGLVAVVGLSGAISTVFPSFHSSRELRGVKMAEGPIQPFVAILDSRYGGVISEVCVRPGDSVKKGQVLLRFDASELRQQLKELDFAERLLRAEVDDRRILENLPNRLKRYLYETHPDVAEAERQYVHALNAWQAAPESERQGKELELAAASAARTRARAHLDRMLADSSSQAAVPEMRSNISKHRAALESVLPELELRASADGAVEVLDVRPNDRILPRLPVAALRLKDEYKAEFEVPDATAGSLHEGTNLYGNDDRGVTLTAVVARVSRRRVPVAFRANRDVEETRVFTLRFHSTQVLVPGSIGHFHIP